MVKYVLIGVATSIGLPLGSIHGEDLKCSNNNLMNSPTINGFTTDDATW